VPFISLVLTFLVSLVVSFGVTFKALKYFRSAGIVGQDVQKKGSPTLPSSGGFPVAIGLFGGVMFYVFIQAFVYSITTEIVFLFAALLTVLLVTFVGFMDDFLTARRGEKRGKNSVDNLRVGLRQRIKPLLVIPAAIPLMVVKAGTSVMTLPFLGTVDFGILYPLLLIPLGVYGASNMVNLLAGFNGVEAGMGIVYFSSLSLYAFTHTNTNDLAGVFALAAVGALIAAYYFGKVPTKILPGDSMTYFLGSVLAVVAILGNMEYVTIVAATPFLIEFVLKARSKFKAHSVGILTKKGTIKSRHGQKIYSLPHLLTRTGKYTEQQVVYAMIGFQLVFATLIWFI